MGGLGPDTPYHVETPYNNTQPKTPAAYTTGDGHGGECVICVIVSKY